MTNLGVMGCEVVCWCGAIRMREVFLYVIGCCIGAAVGAVVGFLFLTLLNTRLDLMTKIAIGAVCGGVLGLIFPRAAIRSANVLGWFWNQ